MAMISKRRRNEASILAWFSISKRNKPAYSWIVKIEAKQTLLILHLRKIEAKQILFFPQIQKIEGERTLFIPQIGQMEAKQSLFIPQIRKIKTKRSLFIPQIRKIEAERTRLIPEIGKIEAKKTNWIEIKRTETVFLKTFMEPRNRFQGTDSASLCPGGPVQQPYSSSVPRLF
jgi:hypothetical protein